MISLNNVTLRYGDRNIFNEVNLTIGERERIGLVGRNGAGKSTLLKIIAGALKPDGGAINYPNGVTIGFLHQDMALPKGKTVMVETLTAFEKVRALERRIREITHELDVRTDYESEDYANLLVELSEGTEQFELLGGGSMEADAERVLSGLGFKPTDMSRLTDEFSGGWQMRIELAKMLLQRPMFLLLDEPTNHLDIESILWLENFLQTYEGSLVLISHDRTFLDNVTKRTVEIELGNVYDYKANYSKFKILQAERRERMQATYDNQQRQIAQTQRLIDKFRAKASKAKMAQSLIKQLDKMDVVEMEQGDDRAMRLNFLPAPRSGQITVSVKNLVKRYGDLTVLNQAEFEMERGDTVAFVGQNGQGKTTLSKIIAGIEAYNAGAVTLGHNVEIGYYAQNQAENMDGNATVLETMEHLAPPEMRPRLRSILGAFMFSGEDVDKKVRVLSGGERARVAMAALLLKPANLLILDEPTNHLDMQSKEVLKEALLQYDGALIVVSHDRDFLAGLTKKTLEFRDKKLHLHLGDIQALLEKRKMENMREVELATKVVKQPVPAVESVVAPKFSVEERKERDKVRKKLEKNVQTAEKDIEILESAIEKYETEMTKTGFFGSKDADFTLKAHQKAKTELDKKMELWEAAQAELEDFLKGE